MLLSKFIQLIFYYKHFPKLLLSVDECTYITDSSNIKKFFAGVATMKNLSGAH